MGHDMWDTVCTWLLRLHNGRLETRDRRGRDDQALQVVRGGLQSRAELLAFLEATARTTVQKLS